MSASKSTITHNNGWTAITLTAPYNKDLNEQYKARGMRWDGMSAMWWRSVSGEMQAKLVEEELLKILGSVFSEVHVVSHDGTTLSHRFTHNSAGAKLLEDLQNVPVNGMSTPTADTQPVRWYRDLFADMQTTIRLMEQGDRRTALEVLSLEHLTTEQISQLGFRLLQAAAQKQKAGTNT